ncbi:MAG: radical SAM protein [Candidatus Portnoybacteria bacterium]|nr:radical SAM protein [Candidatus Portnoybacteria bacterium]
MKPPFLKAIDFSEKDFENNNLLLELRIHVIEECNLKCVYCLSNAPFISEKRENNKTKLSLDEIKNNIKQAKDLGIKVVSITGSGEPLLYRNLKELIDFIKSLDLRVVLFTNSLLLSKELAEWLNERDVNLMVKLNSFNPEINDKLVGLKGAQKIFLEKIKMLVDIGFAKDKRLALNSIICEDNYREIPELFIFCRKNGIIPWIEIATITGRAKEEMKLPKEKTEVLYKKLSEIDKKQFGYEWTPDSPIVGADRRRYKFVAQIDIFGNVYHTDANITDEVGSIRDKSLYDLITSEKFIKLRDRDKHSRNFLEKENSELAEKIYKILTNKKFRAGALPPEDVKKLVLEKIERKVSKNLPIRFFQFWGGCKNPNLLVDNAELCEEATLENLQRISVEVVKIYSPGLKIFVSPGDGRVQNVNKIPKEKTEKYVQTLTNIADKYNGLFSVIPISTLYEKYSVDFEKHLSETKENIGKDICNQPDFEKLVLNARKNIFGNDLESEEKILERSREAAKDYIIYRVVEEESKIFRDFDDFIRSFFIKYIPFYKRYIKNINETKPRLDCSLVFYTGRKGNITQPWQAIGKNGNDNEVLFLSQNRLKSEMDKS